MIRGSGWGATWLLASPVSHNPLWPRQSLSWSPSGLDHPSPGAATTRFCLLSHPPVCRATALRHRCAPPVRRSGPASCTLDGPSPRGSRTAASRQLPPPVDVAQVCSPEINFSQLTTIIIGSTPSFYMTQHCATLYDNPLSFTKHMQTLMEKVIFR